MGEAARRKDEIEKIKAASLAWKDGFAGDEKIVANVAYRTYEAIVGWLGMTEGCYNLAFFLRKHLQRTHSIDAKIVIGWINDGQWAGATSHAWVEFNDKKIDISLNKTSHPDILPPGNLIILDQIIRPGTVNYTYWKDLPEIAGLEMKKMRAEDPRLSALLVQKEIEHRNILAFSATDAGVDKYFETAPPNCKYEYLAKIVTG